MTDDRMPSEQCPSCGRELPETTPGDDGYWYVGDGDDLGCGCAGSWSADGETAYPNHDDEECIQCRDDEIEWLRKQYDQMQRERPKESDGADDRATVYEWADRLAQALQDACAQLLPGARIQDDATVVTCGGCDARWDPDDHGHGPMDGPHQEWCPWVAGETIWADYHRHRESPHAHDRKKHP